MSTEAAKIEEFLPLYDEVAKCGKCGFCQPTCPVYCATGKESYVARGKCALFRNMIEGETVMEADLKEAFENCLLCRACTANCFPAVKTDQLVVAFRESYAQRFGRSTIQRWIFRNFLPYPDRMARLIGLAWLSKRAGMADLAKKMGIVRMINPKLETAMELRDEVPSSFLRGRTKGKDLTAKAESKYKVGYWVSCGYNYMLPEVGEATINVLRHNGADVQVLGNNCCGLPVYGYGDVEGARNLAKKNIDVLGDLDQYDYIVSECGSCSGHLKEYAELLADDSEYSVRAERLLEKVRSFSELLVEIEAEKPQGQVEATITYHDPCHMTTRYQGVVAQPRELIKNVPGVEFKEMPEADWCCGAAGSYNVMHNDVSMKVLERKMGNVAKTEAEIVVTECPSCIMQLSLGAKRQGLQNIKVMNVSQLLDESYRRGESETFAKR